LKIFCGTDIIEIERIKQAIEKSGNSFLNKVYTKNEIIYCESKRKVKYQHYAARFAGKEAVFKAISKILDNKFDIDWKDIEIINDANGRPEVKIYNKKLIKDISVEISISHCKEYATATAVCINSN
jgi:holo-[acyl-carrier protein] synthase